MKINYHKKRFKAVSNSESGEVDSQTLFHYSQEGNVLWAIYQGSQIKLGTITGLVNEDGSLEFSYQHVNEEGSIRSGKCTSTPELLDDGRIKLHEKWQWDGEEEVGESVVEEV
ncbi:n-acetylglutamate synthase [Marinoscillum sp.]|uniref:n-acetylglutamate synthase n=1 Tax=Marinoscillum sp. TaxID=2024838 RepID=UPI003BA957AC